jgi:hypothetical protein
MEMITQASAMPAIFEPSLLVLMSTYLVKAVVFLMLSGAVYASLHRFLANRKPAEVTHGQSSVRSIEEWSHSMQSLYREVD